MINEGRESGNDYSHFESFYRQFFSARKLRREVIERYGTIFRLIEELGLPSNSRVLDIGCGGGVILRELSRKFETINAFDFILSPDMQIVIQDNPQISFVAGQLPYLPYTDCPMDLIIFSEVIEHLHRDDQVKNFEAIARVVKKNGIVILTTPNPIGIRSVAYIPYKAVRKLRGKKPVGQPIENWINLLSYVVWWENGFLLRKVWGQVTLLHLQRGFRYSCSNFYSIYLKRLEKNKSLAASVNTNTIYYDDYR